MGIRRRRIRMNTITHIMDTTNDMGRMNPGDIKHDLCMARDLPDDTIPGYVPAVYREKQCKFKKKVGDLCTRCNKAFEKSKALGEDFQCHKAGHGRWFGLITDDPPPTCHMLGTAWAKKKVSKMDVESISESVAPPAPAPAPAPEYVIVTTTTITTTTTTTTKTVEEVRR